MALREESSKDKQKRLNCTVSLGIDNWRCYKDCAFWDGKKCTNYEEAVAPSGGEKMEEKKASEYKYSDLWVKLKWTIEGSEYCKEIREEDTAPAFGSALCEKCIEKNCRFLGICMELYEMNKKDHEKVEDEENEQIEKIEWCNSYDCPASDVAMDCVTAENQGCNSKCECYEVIEGEIIE
jgi:hypothetical protein